MQQFNEQLSNAIPSEVKEKADTKVESAMVLSLDKSDSQNPNRLYCYKVKRNGKKTNSEQILRSPFNDNKTRIRRKSLYEEFKSDEMISFCYSENQSDEKDDGEIIKNFLNSR
jgi:hypothetical protein